jgi:hypothetical protein
MKTKLKHDLKKALYRGWCLHLYDANLDAENGYIAIAADAPRIFDNAIQGKGKTLEKAISNLMKNIKKDAKDDSDLTEIGVDKKEE